MGKRSFWSFSVSCPCAPGQVEDRAEGGVLCGVQGAPPDGPPLPPPRLCLTHPLLWLLRFAVSASTEPLGCGGPRNTSQLTRFGTLAEGLAAWGHILAVPSHSMFY